MGKSRHLVSTSENSSVSCVVPLGRENELLTGKDGPIDSSSRAQGILSGDGTVVATLFWQDDNHWIRAFRWDGKMWKRHGNDLLGHHTIKLALSSDGGEIAVMLENSVQVHQLHKKHKWMPMGDDKAWSSKDQFTTHLVTLSGDGKTLAILWHNSDPDTMSFVEVYEWVESTRWKVKGFPIEGEPDHISLFNNGMTVVMGGHVYKYRNGSWIPHGPEASATVCSVDDTCDAIVSSVSLAEGQIRMAVTEFDFLSDMQARIHILQLHEKSRTQMEWEPVGAVLQNDSWGSGCSVSLAGDTLSVITNDRSDSLMFLFQFQTTEGFGVWSPVGKVLHSVQGHAHLSRDGSTVAALTTHLHGMNAISQQEHARVLVLRLNDTCSYPWAVEAKQFLVDGFVLAVTVLLLVFFLKKRLLHWLDRVVLSRLVTNSDNLPEEVELTLGILADHENVHGNTIRVGNDCDG